MCYNIGSEPCQCKLFVRKENMSVEQGEETQVIQEDLPQTLTKEELEQLLAVKEPKLPKSIRRYIQRLKQVGMWDVAMGVRAQEMEKAKKKRKDKTKEQRARKELDRTIKQILETDNPQVEAENELKAIWLLDIIGGMDQEERMENLLALLDSKAPELRSFLEENMARIRDETMVI